MGTWKFTELDSDTMSANSEITMQQPADRPSQKWKFLYEQDQHTEASGYFFIVNVKDGKVLDAAKNEPGEQIITYTALRRGTQLWRWDSAGSLVNKAGLVAGVNKKLNVKRSDPVVLCSLTGDSNQSWSFGKQVIKSGLDDLVMDASGSRVTITSISDCLAQKWRFVPEDLWEDYQLMLENKNPLSVAAFWKKVAEYFINVIIGYDVNEYQSRIPNAIVTINRAAYRLDEYSSKTGKVDATGMLSSAAKFAFWPLSQKKTLSSIVNEIWNQQEIKAVKYVVRPLFSATMCLQGFLSRYFEMLKVVSEYLATEEGKEIARDACNIYKKAVEEGVVAWNEDKMGSSPVTSTKQVEQAKQIKDLVKFVQSDYNNLTQANPVVISAEDLSGSLAVFGVAFGVWDAVGGINDINKENELAKIFRRTAQTLKEESGNLIKLWIKLFKRAELTTTLKIRRNPFK